MMSAPRTLTSLLMHSLRDLHGQASSEAPRSHLPEAIKALRAWLSSSQFRALTLCPLPPSLVGTGELLGDEALVSLPCAHVVHAPCIRGWIVHKGATASCPLCKRLSNLLVPDLALSPSEMALAREALDHSQDRIREAAASPDDHQLGAKVTLFGLASLMLRTMEESAGVGIESHGGAVWKAFGRALWLEAQQRREGEA